MYRRLSSLKYSGELSEIYIRLIKAILVSVLSIGLISSKQMSKVYGYIGQKLTLFDSYFRFYRNEEYTFVTTMVNTFFLLVVSIIFGILLLVIIPSMVSTMGDLVFNYNFMKEFEKLPEVIKDFTRSLCGIILISYLFFSSNRLERRLFIMHNTDYKGIKLFSSANSCSYLFGQCLNITIHVITFGLLIPYKDIDIYKKFIKGAYATKYGDKLGLLDSESEGNGLWNILGLATGGLGALIVFFKGIASLSAYAKKKKEYNHLGDIMLDFDDNSKDQEYKELKHTNIITLSLSALLGLFIFYLHIALGVDLMEYKNIGQKFSDVTVVSYYISFIVILPFLMGSF